MFNALSAINLKKSVLPIVEQTRWIRYRKPPHLPRPKGRRFYVRPEKEINQEEFNQFKPYWNLYKTNMRSIYNLFKAEKKFSSLYTDEKIEIDKQNHLRALAENE